MSLGDYSTIDNLEEAKMTLVGLAVMLLKARSLAFYLRLC